MSTPAPEFVIVGRVRRAHGIRGELAVESTTDAPDAVFASGRRVLAGTATGDIAPDAAELVMEAVTPFKGGFIISFRGISTRSQAELWRNRYLLLPSHELEPPDEASGEVYLHELPGMQVVLVSGEPLGSVLEVYELPQGLVLDVQRSGGTVMIPFHESVVVEVDASTRIIRVDPPAGLLD